MAGISYDGWWGEGINRSDECVSGKEKRRGKGGKLVTVSAHKRGVS